MANVGKIAYDAYYSYCEGRSMVSGDLLPTWENQNPVIQEAWESAATAVMLYDAALRAVENKVDPNG